MLLTARFKGALILPAAAALVASSWRAHVQSGLELLQIALQELRLHGDLLSESDLEASQSASDDSSRATAMQVLQATSTIVSSSLACHAIHAGSVYQSTQCS